MFFGLVVSMFRRECLGLGAGVAGVVSLLAGHDPSDLGITVGNLR